MKKWRKYLPYILLLILFISVVGIWYASYGKVENSNILKVIFLDVGQGDAIYIEAPNGRQMLIDGGAGPVVLQRLGEVMPFTDRSIDLLVATHTDADHIGGFSFVLDNYKVDQIITNGGSSDTNTFRSMEEKIVKNKIQKVIADSDTQIILDKAHNIYFDVLFPDRDVSNFKDTNDGSIVGKLVYGEQSFLLTGDATKYTENLIMRGSSVEDLQADVLKLGHHGSRTSSSELFLEKVDPSVAIISAGKNNRYGHPHKEVLDILGKLKIPYLSTYEEGNIIFETDGVSLVY